MDDGKVSDRMIVLRKWHKHAKASCYNEPQTVIAFATEIRADEREILIEKLKSEENSERVAKMRYEQLDGIWENLTRESQRGKTEYVGQFVAEAIEQLEASESLGERITQSDKEADTIRKAGNSRSVKPEKPCEGCPRPPHCQASGCECLCHEKPKKKVR